MGREEIGKLDTVMLAFINHTIRVFLNNMPLQSRSFLILFSRLLSWFIQITDKSESLNVLNELNTCHPIKLINQCMGEGDGRVQGVE